MKKRHILNYIYNDDHDRLKLENCFEIIEREVLEEEKKVEIRSFLYYHGDILAVHIKREELFYQKEEQTEADALFFTVRNYGTMARVLYSVSSWKIFKFWLHNNLNYKGTLERRDISELMGYYNKGGFYNEYGNESVTQMLGNIKEQTAIILTVTKDY